jgi:hypothetical protein
MDSQLASSAEESLDDRLLGAIDNGRTDEVRKLLALGANPNCCATGTVLRNTCQLSGSVGGQGVRRCPAIVLAAAQGAECVLQMLIDAGADLNTKVEFASQSMSALEVAASVEYDGSHDDTIRMLVDAGADTHDSTLLIDIKRSSGRMAELLLAYPQLPEVLNWALVQVGRVYLSQTAEFTVRLAKKLIAAGADVNACVHDGGGSELTPLSAAAILSCGGLVQTLIEHGANPSGERGIEAMARACKYGQDATGIRALARVGVVPTAEMLDSAAENFIGNDVDDKLCAIMGAIHGAGTDPRTLPFIGRRAHGANLVEFVLRNDMAASAGFIFGVLGEDPYGTTKGGAPLTRIAGPSSKAVIMSNRLVGSVASAVGGAAAEATEVRTPTEGITL